MYFLEEYALIGNELTPMSRLEGDVLYWGYWMLDAEEAHNPIKQSNPFLFADFNIVLLLHFVCIFNTVVLIINTVLC